jgi:glycine/D-amino acid oxidase-like deaminating enzyme
MPMGLLVVGGGLFGSLAAAYARTKGVEATVFDAGLPTAASPAAGGLFQERWAGAKLRQHYHAALPLLNRLFDVRQVSLLRDDGGCEAFQFLPPGAVVDPHPVRQSVTAVGDGWLEAGGQRHEGWVYVAAGVWCEQLFPGIGVYGKAGSAFLFPGEQPGRFRPITRGRQALAFVRDPGMTYFSDGTAERAYTADHEHATLARAAEMGLTNPVRTLLGNRPYAPGGPLFRQVGERTWIATGGRKMGTILAAWCARRLVEDELRL